MALTGKRGVRERGQGFKGLAHLHSSYIVALGTLPSELALAGVPRVETGAVGGARAEETARTHIAAQTASLMALLQTRSDTLLPAKQAKVWLGAGLGSVPKKTHEKMMRWEFIDLGELRPKNPLERLVESDTQKLIVLPGFEVSQARQKPINNIVTWTHCYARYVAAMAAASQGNTPGFMAHMITVMKAYTEVEDPAWRLYDEAYREKMSATGCKQWEGMDVQLYQEVCAGRLRRKVGGDQRDGSGGSFRGGIKRVGEDRHPGPAVCWQFNAGACRFGTNCKFAHSCGICFGSHPKLHCPREAEKKRRQV